MSSLPRVQPIRTSAPWRETAEFQLEDGTPDVLPARVFVAIRRVGTFGAPDLVVDAAEMEIDQHIVTWEVPRDRLSVLQQGDYELELATGEVEIEDIRVVAVVPVQVGVNL